MTGCRFSPCGGRLRRELKAFRGVGALGAGVIYLMRFNKSEGRGRAHSPVGEHRLNQQASEAGLRRGVQAWALC